MNPDQIYLKELLDRFNANPDDPTIGAVNRILLNQIREAQQEITSLNSQIEEINSEIKERQERGNTILQRIIGKQGESQGYLTALLKLRE